MGCGGLCGVNPKRTLLAAGGTSDGAACDGAAACTCGNKPEPPQRWGFNPWQMFPPVGANPYDEALGYSGGDLGRDKNTFAPAGTSTGTGGTTSNDAAWAALNQGIQALAGLSTTIVGATVTNRRTDAMAAAAAAGQSDAVISALGGQSPQYTQAGIAPGDVRQPSGNTQSSSSAVPWIVGGAIALLLLGPKGFRL